MLKTLYVALVLLLYSLQIGHSQTTLFASNGGGSRSTATDDSSLAPPTIDAGALMILNQASGLGSVVGTPLSGVGITGIDFNPAGELIGITNNASGPSRLIKIDTATGAVIGTPINVLVGIGDAAVDPGFTDLAIHPTTGIIYATVADNNTSARIVVPSGPAQNDIVTINPSTGEAIVIGNPAPSEGFMAITFGTDGTFYGITNIPNNDANSQESITGLFIINPTNGSVISTHALTPAFGAIGLGFDPFTGLLWASECCSDSPRANQIYTVDPSNFTVSLVGAAGGVRRVHDLAFRDDRVINLVPTMGEWGVINLSLILMIVGVASVRQQRPSIQTLTD